MNIFLLRHHRSRWGVDGTLEIRGRRVCDTVEHPLFCLPEGVYKVALNLRRRTRKRLPTVGGRATLMTGNGPFRCKDGSIVVGKHYISGVLTSSCDRFSRLYERIEKCVKRHESITLTIKD